MSDTEFAPAQKTTLSLLVVDDDQDIRDLMADYLRQHGFAVRAADGGDAMFACIEEEKPDLIVLDIMMPGEDGLSLCRRLRTGVKVFAVLQALLGLFGEIGMAQSEQAKKSTSNFVLAEEAEVFNDVYLTAEELEEIRKSIEQMRRNRV